jgi:alkylation response protein AidB-like acyl-CoA dehydrogenase
LHRFGAVVLTKRVLDWVHDCEKNPPYLKPFTTFGKRQDELVTSEGWRQLQELGFKEGIVAIGHEGNYSGYERVVQFLKYHIWTGSNACVTCPSAMQDGAAVLLRRHLDDPNSTGEKKKILESAHKKLVSRDPDFAWTSGQWMTERTGGSDVSGTETLAFPVDQNSAEARTAATASDGQPLGDWSINGFKWFSSATDSGMTVLLARTPDGKISTFFAPMRRTVSASPYSSDRANSLDNGLELNGIQIQRLKSKLGTRAVPTAELVLSGMRAHLLGKPGDGIREISAILNVTRVHNAVTAMGLWGRGLAILRAFSRVRTVDRGKKLTDLGSHVIQIAGQEVRYRGWMHVTFFTALLLGLNEQPGRVSGGTSGLLPPDEDVKWILRALTSVTKAGTALESIQGLQKCMEGLGGVGYCENEEMDLNIARLYRDANVLSIWEGTTSVMCHDLLKVLKGRDSEKVLGALERWVSGGLKEEEIQDTVKGRWDIWVKNVREKGIEELLLDGRKVLFELGEIVGAVLLLIDSKRDGDLVVGEIAKRWINGGEDDGSSIAERVQWSRRIVFPEFDVKVAGTSKL